MAILEEVERQALTAADADFSSIQTSLEHAAKSGALDSEAFERFADTAQEVAARLNDSLPPEIDPRASDEIRRRLISIIAPRRREGSPLDVADDFLLEMEAVRHVLRDLIQEQPPVDLRDGAAVIKLLEGWLPRLGVNRLAELLGMSPRQLQRRRRDGGPSTHRAELVARLVAILRHAWTDEGVAAWFFRSRPEFEGAPPIALLDDPQHEADLITAARSGRVQGGG